MAGRLDRLASTFERQGRGEPGAVPFEFARRDEEGFVEIPLDHIEPDPDQPRKAFDDLDELAASIREHGIIQPLVVSATSPDRFRIIAGERRYRAAALAGLSTVPVIVRSIEQHRILEVQLIENLQRRDLNTFEEAASYQRLLTEFGLSQGDLAKRLGMKRQTINDILAVNRLPETIRDEACRMSGTHSKSLLLEIAKAGNESQQRELWDRVVRENLTVAEARQARSARQAPVRSARNSSVGFAQKLPVTGGTVTVHLRAAQPTTADVLRALDEAREELSPAIHSGW